LFAFPMTNSFNPRLPGGKATTGMLLTRSRPSSFNPRLPGGKATQCSRQRRPGIEVSIHAFRGGRRRQCSRQRRPGIEVSIHAFRGGRRQIQPLPTTSPQRFNPRLPGGKATSHTVLSLQPLAFQSTPSGGEGDQTPARHPQTSEVSIHAFRGGRRRRD